MAKPIKAPRTFPFDQERFFTITADMTADEFRAYVLIMVWTWKRGGKPLPDNPKVMAKKLRCTEERWLKSIRPGLVAECGEGEEQLFDLDNGTFRMHEMEEIWDFVQKKIAVKRTNGQQGGRPPAVKFDVENQNLTAQNPDGIAETQTANPLIYQETDKAIGSVTVTHPVPGSFVNLNLDLKEESKKESPLTPQGGNGEDLKQIPVQAQAEPLVDTPAQTPGPERVTSETVYRSTEPERMLFPVQEVQTKKSRKSRVLEARQIDEAFAAFMEAYPARLGPHSSEPAKKLFSKAMRDGVDPAVMIQSAKTYCKDMEFKGNIHTEHVADAKWWLNDKRWKDYQNYVPKKPPATGNVTPLRGTATTNGQVSNEHIRRGGRVV